MSNHSFKHLKLTENDIAFLYENIPSLYNLCNGTEEENPPKIKFSAMMNKGFECFKDFKTRELHNESKYCALKKLPKKVLADHVKDWAEQWRKMKVEERRLHVERATCQILWKLAEKNVLPTCYDLPRTSSTANVEGSPPSITPTQMEHLIHYAQTKAIEHYGYRPKKTKERVYKAGKRTKPMSDDENEPSAKKSKDDKGNADEPIEDKGNTDEPIGDKNDKGKIAKSFSFPNLCSIA